jgi:hypothetical protein
VLCLFNATSEPLNGVPHLRANLIKNGMTFLIKCRARKIGIKLRLVNDVATFCDRSFGELSQCASCVLGAPAVRRVRHESNLV